MRRPVAVVLMAIMGVAIAGPGLAQDEGFINPLDILIDAFDAPNGMEYLTRLIEAPVAGGGINLDPTGDFEHPTGQIPMFTPDHTDITNTSSLEFDAGPIEGDLFGTTDQSEVWAPTGPSQVEPPNYEPFITIVGEQIQEGFQYENGSVLFGFSLAGTPPLPVPGRCEYVVWINDLSRGPTFVNHPTFPGDPASGTNLAFGLRLNPEGEGSTSTFASHLQDDSGFVENPLTDVRSFITPNYVGIFVPKAHIGEMEAVNFHTFCMEEGTASFDPAMSGGDQSGLTGLTLGDLGLVAIEQQAIVIPTTSTLVDTTTTLDEDDFEDTTAGTEVAEVESGFPWWLVLVIGGLGLTVAGWFFFGMRDDQCTELRDAWRAAAKKSDSLLTEANGAAGECESVEVELEELETGRKDLCMAWPPACWKSEEGKSIEDSEGKRITSRDVHLRKMALGEAWDDYKAGKLTATEVEAKFHEVDTPEFRNEITQLDREYKQQLAEIESEIGRVTALLDNLWDKAEQARANADDAASGAESARIAYEECVALQEKAETVDSSSER